MTKSWTSAMLASVFSAGLLWYGGRMKKQSNSQPETALRLDNRKVSLSIEPTLRFARCQFATMTSSLTQLASCLELERFEAKQYYIARISN